MTVCENCGEYFHIDEIETCPKCGAELCEGCFEEHMRKCSDSTEDFE